MEKTPSGTSVGVDDPYDHVDRCDHLTDEGRCRFAVERGRRDPAFADRLSAGDFRCPVACEVDGAADGDASADGERVGDTEATAATGDGEPGLTGPWDWRDCPHFRCRTHDRECERCGLEERRMAHDDERPLLEEHHLSYPDDSRREVSHEVTVYLCRWCHAKVHDSWARIDDDASPDPEALAEREGRRSRERAELGFRSAADRFDGDR